MKHRKSDPPKKNPTRKRNRSSRVVIITGLSGSGKTVALRTLEDMHFFCVDNLPVSLMRSLITKVSATKRGRNIAIGIDIREKAFFSDFNAILGSLRKKHSIEILFLEAETDILIRRYKETRRPHPLGGHLEEAIKAERHSLSILRECADRIIDTSSYTPHQLRRLISSYYPEGKTKGLTIALISFGFKYGAPQNVDLLFDVRFLPNPFFVPSLKNLTGQHKKVSDFVFKHNETRELMEKIRNLLNFAIPLYIKEGKSYLSIAVGCTGGNHRSPAIVEELAKSIQNRNAVVTVIHRDMA